MAVFSFKKTIFRGVAFALPLGVVAYVFIRFVSIFEKIVSPLAKKAGIENILGELTLTVLAIAIMLLMIFFLGILMRFSFFSSVNRQLEEVILKLAPSLNHFKMMAAEKLDIDNASTAWKPVLIYVEEVYLPAYIIEENKQWITFAKVKAPSTQPDEIAIIKKENTSYVEITMLQMRQFNRQFGKGYIALIEKK